MEVMFDGSKTSRWFFRNWVNGVKSKLFSGNRFFVNMSYFVNFLVLLNRSWQKLVLTNLFNNGQVFTLVSFSLCCRNGHGRRRRTTLIEFNYVRFQMEIVSSTIFHLFYLQISLGHLFCVLSIHFKFFNLLFLTISRYFLYCFYL